LIRQNLDKSSFLCEHCTCPCCEEIGRCEKCGERFEQEQMTEIKKRTIEEILKECMLPIEIIGCTDPDIQLAHFKAMKEIYEKNDG